MEYFQDGEYEKAIKYIQPLSSRQMTIQVYQTLLNSFLALKDYDEAEKLNKNFIRNSRLNQMELLADKIYIFDVQADEKGANKAFKQLKSKVEQNPNYAFTASQALQKKGYPERALEVFDLAQSINPNYNFDYQRAQLYGELGEVNKMYEMYVSMLVRSPNYLNSVKNLISQGIAGFDQNHTDYLKELLIREIQSGGPSTLNDLLIHVYIQEENFSGAFTQLKALDRRGNGNKSELFFLGRIAQNAEEYRLAERVFDYIIKAGDENPYYEDALVARLEARRKALEKGDKGLKYNWRDLKQEYLNTKKELIGFPEIGMLSIDLAHFMAFRLGEIDSSITLLKEVLKTGYVLKEDGAKAKIELGDILLFSGERWEAILYYGQAEKDFENSPIGQMAKFKRAKAAYYVGDFQWAQGIFDALKASTSKLIANDAMHYSLLINDNIALDTSMEAMAAFAKADLMNYQAKQDSALFILKSIQKNFPNHTLQDDILLLSADIHMEKGEFNTASEELQSIIDHFSDGILADDAIIRLARIYENEMNRSEEAKNLYQKLFTEHPDSFFASEARAKFRTLRGDILN
tara:strand:- start:55563 stop:57290 length:1728 start_codon:yes stop_codon:yes gene_type:complete